MTIFSVSSVGEWTTSIATLLGALGAFITAMYSLHLGKNNKGKIDNVREIVNGNSKAEEARNAELLQLLQSNGIKVPPKKVS